VQHKQPVAGGQTPGVNSPELTVSEKPTGFGKTKPAQCLTITDNYALTVRKFNIISGLLEPYTQGKIPARSIIEKVICMVARLVGIEPVSGF